MKLSRKDRSLISEWWFTVDRLMLGAIILIMIIGVLLSLAASPAIALKHNLEAFYFVKRHALFFLPTLFLMIVVSLLSPQKMRRIALILLLLGLLLMVYVILFGVEINGATRWLRFGSFALQPSEFTKAAFVVLVAWLFAEKKHRPDMPTTFLAILLYLVFIGLLVLEPDVGQAFLTTVVWTGLFFLAGLSLHWIGILGALMLGAMVFAYSFFPHVAGRIDKFIDPKSGDSFQTEHAIQSFQNGGWFGLGPGEGKIKHILPDAHTDFIFSVLAEEFGVIACLILVSVFAFIVIRGLLRAFHERDHFIRYATVGLIMLFGLQTIINMSVNIGLLPAKGMTLPFISYGGSSMMSMALTMGMVLGLTRKRPELSFGGER